MLSVGIMGGLAFSTTPVMASVAQQAKTIKVSGLIVDQDGEPLIGATVRVKNSQTATVTNIDGNFELSVPSNATLVISYIGYKDREIAVRGRVVDDCQEARRSDDLPHIERFQLLIREGPTAPCVQILAERGLLVQAYRVRRADDAGLLLAVDGQLSHALLATLHGVA